MSLPPEALAIVRADTVKEVLRVLAQAGMEGDHQGWRETMGSVLALLALSTGEPDEFLTHVWEDAQTALDAMLHGERHGGALGPTHEHQGVAR